jgi:hypothetical protein
VITGDRGGGPGGAPDLAVYEDMEQCFARGWSDGLPVVPPYGSLVGRMLDAMGWRATDVVGEIAAQSIEIRAEHLAAAAVMAGCRFEYGPLLRSLSELLVDPAFNLSGVEVTTGGVAALVIVSGPVVDELGFEHGANALGANCRANATVGRFAQMARYFCGRGGGALHSHGTMGHPGRLSFCIAERPDRRWPPFHTQTGLPADVSAVSVMAAEGPNSVNNHYGDTAEAVLDTIADCLGHAGATSYYWHFGPVVVVLGPAHAELVAAACTRDQARRHLFERARRGTDDLRRLGRLPAEPRAKSKVEPGTMRSPFDHEEQIHFLESGADGGRFSAVIPGWVGNYHVTSRAVAA